MLGLSMLSLQKMMEVLTTTIPGRFYSSQGWHFVYVGVAGKSVASFRGSQQFFNLVIGGNIFWKQLMSWMKALVEVGKQPSYFCLTCIPILFLSQHPKCSHLGLCGFYNHGITNQTTEFKCSFHCTSSVVFASHLLSLYFSIYIRNIKIMMVQLHRIFMKMKCNPCIWAYF